MENILKILESESVLVWIVVVSLLFLLLAISGIFIHAYFTDRLISFWPPKLGPKNGKNSSSNMGQPIWHSNSREVNESIHWSESSKLIVGVQYSPKYFKDYFTVVKKRSQQGLTTVALVLDPKGSTAEHLRETRADQIDIEFCVDEITRLMREADDGRGYIKIKKHNRTLKYSFILTEKCIWVKFFTNTADRAIVPAVKVNSNDDLYKFFSEDSERLELVSHE